MNGDYVLIQTFGVWCWLITQDSLWVRAIKILMAMGLSLLLKPTWINVCDVSHCSNSLGIDFSTDKCTIITLFKSQCSNSLGNSKICCGWAFQMKLFFVIFVAKIVEKDATNFSFCLKNTNIINTYFMFITNTNILITIIINYFKITMTIYLVSMYYNFIRIISRQYLMNEFKLSSD